jgi:2-hydroxy-6-oxonona-2,4-dienedioate hydrolase
MNEMMYREAERRLWESKGVIPTERQIHLQRNDVTVRILEVGDGPAVVFVHGGNVAATSWAALVARLQGFRCILVDRPGCGLSSRLPFRLDSESLPRSASTLVVDVLDALSLESAHLLGTSFGGYIGLQTAAAHPERIGRMVQFSWPIGAPNARTPAFMRMAAVRGVGRLMTMVPPNERTVRAIFRSIGHRESLKSGRITPEDVAWYLALLRHTDTMRNEFAWGRALMSPVRGLKREVEFPDAFLASVTTPTLFLWGENDPFGGAEVARRVVARVPSAELVLLPGAGHAPWLDELDRCVDATAGFLAQTEPPTSVPVPTPLS